MPDLVNNAFWYTVWDAKTGDLLASGMQTLTLLPKRKLLPS